VDYDAAIERILAAARQGRPYAVTALAVHGIMTGFSDPGHRYRLNHLDLVTPDGQPVRWALNRLYGTGLSDRVYGPKLTVRLCEAAQKEELPVFFYGSSPQVIEGLRRQLAVRFPDLKLAGAEPSKFRATSEAEKLEIAARIRDSGARITFVGLGCPRQEVFVYEYRDALQMPLLAVGAAFDYLAGTLQEPPEWIQRAGVQWLYRFVQEPRRLWHRYGVLNPKFVSLFLLQSLGVWKPDPQDAPAPVRELLYG